MNKTRRAVLLLALSYQWASAAALDTPLRLFGMDSRPVSYMKDGKPTGIAVELAQEVQRRLGRNDPIQIVPWARAQTVAQYERNVMLLSIVPTPERAAYLVFAGPLFMAHISVFVKADKAEALRGLGNDAYSLRAGARRGSIFSHVARREGLNVTDETNSSDLGVRMLMQGRFDLLVEGEEIAWPALERAGYRRGDMALLRTLGREDVFFAFSRDTPPDVVRAWNEALRDMKRDGTFMRIHRKWLQPHQLPSDMRAPAK